MLLLDRVSLQVKTFLSLNYDIRCVIWGICARASSRRHVIRTKILFGTTLGKRITNGSGYGDIRIHSEGARAYCKKRGCDSQLYFITAVTLATPDPTGLKIRPRLQGSSRAIKFHEIHWADPKNNAKKIDGMTHVETSLAMESRISAMISYLSMEL